MQTDLKSCKYTHARLLQASCYAATQQQPEGPVPSIAGLAESLESPRLGTSVPIAVPASLAHAYEQKQQHLQGLQALMAADRAKATKALNPPSVAKLVTGG